MLSILREGKNEIIFCSCGLKIKGTIECSSFNNIKALTQALINQFPAHILYVLETG